MSKEFGERTHFENKGSTAYEREERKRISMPTDRMHLRVAVLLRSDIGESDNCM